ncbi:uncharacterized protein At4g10930 isoform X2 [Impatiens glandulifera]|uniref:uncharacterized protein At4g10930 isoform X2 n=1 Tax=Impatiens glandulifera TaxID=253017 RepID=UPI001FB10098|nr:uncharacterized protein At4g10930 isoform X2 [Impatiens glandulifera]
MEVSLFSDDISEDPPFEFDKYNEDYTTVDGERCGICMEIVIDRGVLDCCEHWFCFTCIDNWSTITNLCPLCQTEFQLITCLPVYDTVGSNKVDEDSPYRDEEEEDWFIEGKSNTLSFPSYYIDENAVTCLDGDDCIMRSGSVSSQEDPNLDTSIACDSCNTWYHAFCVGFDPDATCETSWLCPRCLVKENLNESDVDPGEFPSSFSAKVSVSVADAGETAMIVSMVQDNPITEGPSGPILTENIDKDETFVRMTSLVANFPMLDIPSTGKAICHTNLEVEGSDLSLQQDASSSSLPVFIGQDNFENISLAKGIIRERRSKESFSNNDQSKPDIDLRLVLSEGCASSGVDIIKNDATQTEVTMDFHPKNTLDHRLLPATKMVLDSKNNVVGVKGGKRKCREPSDDVDTAPENETKPKSGASTKKIRTRNKVQVIHVPDEPRKCPSPIAVSQDNRINLKQTSNASDIMSIIRETKSSSNIENATGLRMKKILRTTAAGDKESFNLVQSLRKEIREAVRNKPSNDLGENRFDPKLLAAFRAALIGSVTEPTKPNLAVKAKKLIFQKGGVRENLTKKIYGINGRRKRAWTRDCEIEFWKHRCSKVSKPEKVETLKSVLNHLKKGSDEIDMMKNGTECADGNPILSRLYLADTSVFPRKDDVKPLSASEEASSGSTRIARNPQLNKQSETGKCVIKRTGKEASSSNDDGPKDKRKWAMEILARKNAMSSKSVVGGEKQTDNNDIPKGNYPLTAQLPTQMRPVLATSLHKKIPVAVRQAQLYRLTEHFLRKANLPVICRTAETEFAVADAVNIEKGIADRSNSKVVYLNLMSQEILHRLDVSKSSGATETNSSSPIPPDIVITPDIYEEAIGVPEVEQALISAGFMSDSPPLRIEEEEGGVDNILEMDSSYPELDIYGDFEYDLEDSDLIGGSSSTVIAKPQPDESKMKVVFSSFSIKGQDNEEIEKMNSTKDSSCSNLNLDMNMEKNCPPPPPPMELSTDLELEEPSQAECEELYGPEKEQIVVEKFPYKTNAIDDIADKAETLVVQSVDLLQATTTTELSNQQTTSTNETIPAKKELIPSKDAIKQSDNCNPVAKKVEAYIKEHIRPLCKSGVITVHQYRMAVRKTTDKVMTYHSKDKNANFLIKEGEKVKKLAEQYIEAAAKQAEQKRDS